MEATLFQRVFGDLLIISSIICSLAAKLLYYLIVLALFMMEGLQTMEKLLTGIGGLIMQI